ncbi:MAG: hypothetical protein JNK78_14290 [Planctomycetes bacterium]|nr:hypothetical protein [Planctomycetota bacterium]
MRGAGQALITSRIVSRRWTARGALILCAACAGPDPADANAAPWRYALTWDPSRTELRGEVTAPPGDADVVAITEQARPFFASDEGWSPTRDGAHSLHWTITLDAAARTLDDVDRLAARGSGFVGTLDVLLPLPTKGEDDAPFTLQVNAPPGETFACASESVAEASWRGTLGELRRGPACALGAIAVRSLAPEYTRITIADLAPGANRRAAALDAHVVACTRATAAWFGRFPVDRLLLLALPTRGPTISGGSARGAGGARIVLDVPAPLRPHQLANDWVLIHEMVHLALPSLPPAQHWLEEGSATYAEPLIQAAAGRVTVESVWAATIAEFPQGLAPPERGGLDDDSSWGRTYYGGALFCLIADVRIRQRTENRRSLRDALRAVLAADLDITDFASIDEVLALGDEGTGTSVLRELHAATSKQPFAIDLDGLWRDLGVRLDGSRVVFDDTAPLADIRRELVQGPGAERTPDR